MSVAPAPAAPSPAASTRPSSAAATSDLEEKGSNGTSSGDHVIMVRSAGDSDKALLSPQQQPLRAATVSGSPHVTHHYHQRSSLVSSTGSSPPSSETRGQLAGQRINLQKLSVGLNVDASRPAQLVCNNLNESTVDLVERSVVEFDLEVFFREFAYNLLFPLSVPFVLYNEGSKGAENRGFWKLKPTFFLQIFIASVVVFVNYVYFRGQGTQLYFIEVLALDAMLLLRCAVIGCKYAYFSPSLLADLRAQHAPHTQQRQQIISGWQVPTATTIQQELSFAVTRNMMDLAESYLHFDDKDAAQLRFKTALADTVLQQHPDFAKWEEGVKTDGQVHARVVLTQMMLDSVSAIVEAAKAKKITPIMVTLALIQANIGSFVRAGNGLFYFGSGASDNAAVPLMLFVLFFLFWSNVQFLIVAIMDFKRRLFVFNDFSDMLTDRMRNFKLQKDVLPTIDWGCPNNMGQWHQARVIAKDYGKQYFYRIQGYTSFFLVAVLAMMGFLFYQVFRGGAEMATIVYVLFDFFILMSIFIHLVYLGQQINNAALEHRFILLKKQNSLQVLMAEDQIHHMKKGERKAPKRNQLLFNTTVSIISGIVKLMEVDAEENPLTILGFSATSNFARGLFTIGVTGIGIAVRLLS